MKIIISESQYSKLFKSGSQLESVIVDYLNKMMSGTKRTMIPKSRNYGNLREDWCKDGKEFMSAHYYFGEVNDDEGYIPNQDFYDGQIFISQHIINTISKFFNVRQKFILNVIAEWYDETYAQKFAKEMNEPHLHINDAEPLDKEYDCAPDITVPEDISDKEMIDFIVKHTLYRENEVIDMINNKGVDLKEFYLEILEIQDRHKRLGI
jgi:hypothetical protein